MRTSKTRFHRHANRVVTFALLGGLIVAASGSWVGQWLVVNQRPHKVSAIIVLGGGPINRLQRAVILFHHGYAARLILSGGTQDWSEATQAQVMGWQAVNEFGIPKHDIVLDNQSVTTYQNALDTRAIMLHKHWTSAIVVSSDYHMRRVQFLFSHVFHAYSIRLIYVAASDPWFRPKRWWSNPKSAATTIGEYAKLLVNALQVYVPRIVMGAHRPLASGQTAYHPKLHPLSLTASQIFVRTQWYFLVYSKGVRG